MSSSRNPERIVLVGPKHVGKSTVGKLLARRLGCRFLDLDEVVERQTGQTPRALFEQGAEIFRQAEAEAARQVASGASAVVVATGGGICDNPAAFEAMARSGRIVNLELSAVCAWQRVENAALLSGSLPPFLRTENPEQTHRALHERRSLLYKEKASISICTDNKSPDAIAIEIIEILEKSHKSSS